MNCWEIREMISRYVDDDLSQEEQKAFASHIQSCSDCRKELEVSQSLHQLFLSAEKFEAPYGFVTKVMAGLEHDEESVVLRLWNTLTIRPFFLRTAEVAFAIAVICIGILSGSVLVKDRVSDSRSTVQESFSLDLFQATPPSSIGGVYVSLAGVDNEE